MRFRHYITALLAILLSIPPLLLADITHLPGTQKSLEWVPVGDPGNAPDDRPRQANGFDHTQGVTEWRPNGSGPCGRVAYEYYMGKYIVTAAQYAEFLNAVAKDDPYQLWNSSMGLPPNVAAGQMGSITRTGTRGDYTYDVRPGRENMPAVGVSWGSAARFANWLTNGQPAAPESDATTEAGSYTLRGLTNPAQINKVIRNPNAVYVIPDVDEWYKAAYYKGHGLNSGYWNYPTCSDAPPSNVLSATGTNNANFFDNEMSAPDTGITEVGAFANSPGPYGTFDQGGNIWQWNEAVFNANARGTRSGAYGRYGSNNGYGGDMLYGPYYLWWMDVQSTGCGFRIARLLQPGESLPPPPAIDPLPPEAAQALPQLPATATAPLAVIDSVSDSAPSANRFLWIIGIGVAIISLLFIIFLLLVFAKARVPSQNR